MSDFPESRKMLTVRIDPKGQLVIPKEVREMFGLQTGDTLLLLADKERGIALRTTEDMNRLADAILRGERAPSEPVMDDARARTFAERVQRTIEEECHERD